MHWLTMLGWSKIVRRKVGVSNFLGKFVGETVRKQSGVNGSQAGAERG